MAVHKLTSVSRVLILDSAHNINGKTEGPRPHAVEQFKSFRWGSGSSIQCCFLFLLGMDTWTKQHILASLLLDFFRLGWFDTRQRTGSSGRSIRLNERRRASLSDIEGIKRRERHTRIASSGSYSYRDVLYCRDLSSASYSGIPQLPFSSRVSSVRSLGSGTQYGNLRYICCSLDMWFCMDL